MASAPNSPLRALVDDIGELLEQRSGRVMVGIVGAPGSGKSVLAESVVAHFNTALRGLAAYLPMDGFHLSNAQLERLGRRDRKGAPDTFDVAGYVATLERLAREYELSDVYVPRFDRSVDEPVAAGKVVFAVSRLVITEGNYLALTTHGWQPVAALLHRIYYLDCPEAVRRKRLVERHIAGGRSPAKALDWVMTVDEPNARLIETSRAACSSVLAAT